jgi:hypothetical protein
MRSEAAATALRGAQTNAPAQSQERQQKQSPPEGRQLRLLLQQAHAERKTDDVEPHQGSTNEHDGG